MIIVCSVNVIDILCLGWQIYFNRPTGQGAFHVHYAGDTPTYAIVHANTMEILTLGTKIQNQIIEITPIARLVGNLGTINTRSSS